MGIIKVVLDRLSELDRVYSRKLGTLFPSNSIIRSFFIIATQTGTFFAWAIGIIIAYFSFPDSQVEVLSLASIFVIMLLPVFAVKQAVRRRRPEYKDDRFGTVAFDKFSFPSGHATRAMYAMVLMPYYTPNLWLFWIIWGVLMIISRLILGVHYISDIVFGILLGVVCILFFITIGWVPIVPFLESWL